GRAVRLVAGGAAGVRVVGPDVRRQLRAVVGRRLVRPKVHDAPQAEREGRHQRAATPHLRLSGIRITYPARSGGAPFVAVDGVDLEVREGEFITIVGPSGCGKSTLLLAVDGLVTPAAGEIVLG